MKPEKIIEHYALLDKNQETDFRNSNLRKLILKETKNGKVLDLGCGTGYMTLEMLKKGFDVVAVDALQEMVSSTTNLVESKGYKVRIEKLPIEEIGGKFNDCSFDTILLMDILEHVKEDEKALRTLFPLLKKEGILIVTTSAYEFCYGKRDRQMGHFRRYSKKNLLSKIVKSGFKIKKVRYWNIIGLLPYLFYEKILKKGVNENIRYCSSKKSFYLAVYNFLNKWFALVENKVNFGMGLSLVVVAQRPKI